MIGQKSFADLTTRYCETINELHVHYATGGLNYDVAFIEESNGKRRAIKDEILNHLPQVFEEIYNSKRPSKAT